MPRIIDADGHVMERGQEDLGKYMPKGSQGSAVFPALDHMHGFRLRPVRESGSGGFGNVDRAAWLQFLEDTEIEWSALYPTSGLAMGRIVSEDWAVAACHAYNSWLYDKFTDGTSTLKGVALLPIQDVESAVAELRRAVEELGFVGAMLPSGGEGVKANYGSKIYWPLFEEAQRLNCSLAIHGGSHHHMGLDSLSSYYPVSALGHPFGLMIQAGAMISQGIFEKFPRLRVAYLEGGAAWVPFFFDRMDRAYSESHYEVDLQGDHVPGPNPRTLRPSDYFKQKIQGGNIFVGFDVDDEGLGDAVARAGRGAFLYASDFPHEGHDANLFRHEAQELMAREDLSSEDKAAVMSLNAERFYGIRV